MRRHIGRGKMSGAQTHTHEHTHTHTHSHTYARVHTYSHSHWRTNTHEHTHTHALTHVSTSAHILTLTLTHEYTRAHTYARTHKLDMMQKALMGTTCLLLCCHTTQAQLPEPAHVKNTTSGGKEYVPLVEAHRSLTGSGTLKGHYSLEVGVRGIADGEMCVCIYAFCVCVHT